MNARTSTQPIRLHWAGTSGSAVRHFFARVAAGFKLFAAAWREANEMATRAQKQFPFSVE